MARGEGSEALGLQRQYRLTKDIEFKQLRSKGRSWANPLVVLYTLPSDQGTTRIGISASKRVGNAVKRNRAKRLIREAVRLRYKEISPGWDLLFIARKPIAEARFEQADKAIEQLLRRADVLTSKAREPFLGRTEEPREPNSLRNAGSGTDESSSP